MKNPFFGAYYNSRARLTSAVEIMVLHLNLRVKHEKLLSIITIIKLDSFHIASVF